MARPLAVLYDVHGNLPALEAVLADVHQAGADRVVLGGDYALFGPHPAETVARLDSLPDATWIRGNVDRWTAHPDQAPNDELIRDAIGFCTRALGAETVSRLDALPEQALVADTRFCHASPLSDLESFLPAPAEDEDRLVAGVQEPRLVFGHTHLQFRRTRADGLELVNPGSVGMPMDGDPRAAYALLHEDGSVELRRVDYDNEATAAEMAWRLGDAQWVSRTVNRLRSGRP